MIEKLFILTQAICSYHIFVMASTSGIVTPLVVGITERARLVFKRNSFKSIEDDLEGAFSFIPYGVLHNVDIRPYIHYNIEEHGYVDILSLLTKHMMDGMGNLKSEFKSLQTKGFIQSFIYQC